MLVFKRKQLVKRRLARGCKHFSVVNAVTCSDAVIYFVSGVIASDVEFIGVYAQTACVFGYVFEVFTVVYLRYELLVGRIIFRYAVTGQQIRYRNMCVAV